MEIDPDIVRRVSEAAEERGVNKWEIVEAALAAGLPQLAPPTGALFPADRRSA